MSVNRTHCGDCGFEVAARTECPLCGHTLTERASPTDTLRVLFGD